MTQPQGMDPQQMAMMQQTAPRPAPVGWSTQQVQMSRDLPGGGQESKVMVELTFFHPLGTTVTFWSPDDLHRLSKDLKGAASDANREVGAQQNGSGLLTPQPSQIILPGQG